MSQSKKKKRALGVLTSGGDAPGMNPAVRAVVRSGLQYDFDVYAIYEGYLGMVQGGSMIKECDWSSVSGILYKGGTTIGTARSEDFVKKEGRQTAVHNLIKRGINHLVVIGGDGSLTGANLLRDEWNEHVKALKDKGSITAKTAKEYPMLHLVGLVGSIDNDMVGTDMTIGADTALKRITEAVDSLISTAASHQRTFVIEVMGRNCGYLALMSAMATGADYTLIPESPPKPENWEQEMCELLREGREAGRRESIVIIAEGARDYQGNPISSDHVKNVLEKDFGQDTRVTNLGHVQRGGSPSAYDRYMSTVLGHEAIRTLYHGKDEDEAKVIGMRQNRVYTSSLMESVKKTHQIADHIQNKNYSKAVDLRGGSFRENLNTFNTLAQALPITHSKNEKPLRIGVMNASGPAPGMNTATRAVVRLGLDEGHKMVGIEDGFRGLINNEVTELDWMSCEAWASIGGSELGTNRIVPKDSDFYNIAKNIEKNQLDALFVIGGWMGYESVYKLLNNEQNYPAFKIPMICLPASINNNLPNSELSIGADTALNSIVEVVDKIKQSAVASNRAFVVEVMGRYCGYLALMSGMATGAERMYIHEHGIHMNDLVEDVEKLNAGFREGKRLGLVILSEYANPIYKTNFIASLYQEEGGDLFGVRQAILGHLQQGGDPSPFDRIQATRLSARGLDHLIKKAKEGSNEKAMIGLEGGSVRIRSLEDFPRMVDWEHKRPKKQWWLELEKIAKILAQGGPQTEVPIDE